MRVLPALAQAVVVLAEHASGEILLFAVEPRPAGEDLRGFAFVFRGGLNPARRLQHCAHQRPGGVRVFLHPVATRPEDFFRMVGPDRLRRGGGKTDAVVDGTRVPRLADAKADHVANAHVHHHLRRRHHHRAHVVKGVNARAGQPVVEPHGVRPGREGVREGIGANRLLPNPLFQPVKVTNALLCQIAGERNRLTVLVEGHQVSHLLWLAGDAQLQSVQQAVKNVRGIEFARHQLVAHRRPARLFGGHDGNTVFFIKPFQRRDNHRGTVGQRDKPDAHCFLLRFIRACRPCGLHDTRQQHCTTRQHAGLQKTPSRQIRHDHS